MTVQLNHSPSQCRFICNYPLKQYYFIKSCSMSIYSLIHLKWWHWTTLVYLHWCTYIPILVYLHTYIVVPTLVYLLTFIGESTYHIGVPTLVKIHTYIGESTFLHWYTYIGESTYLYWCTYLPIASTIFISAFAVVVVAAAVVVVAVVALSKRLGREEKD